MQDRFGHLDSQSQYSHASTTDDSNASTSALADKLDKMALEGGGQDTAAHRQHANGNHAHNADVAGGHNALSSKAAAAAALIEDNDFDDSVEELNRDLPPHACR